MLLATTKTDKDFVPLCLPPWVIPLSMAVLILEGLKNHHSDDSYLMIFKFQYPPSLCTSFQNSIFFSSERGWRTAIFDLCGFLGSVFKRTSSAPKELFLWFSTSPCFNHIIYSCSDDKNAYIFRKLFLKGLTFKRLHTKPHYEESIEELLRSCHFP